MSFRGDVGSMALDEVFNFLAQNGLTGVLAVASGDEVTVQLYFREGILFFPERSRRGTYHLGKILRHTGVLSREGLREYLQGLGTRKRKLKDQEESPAVTAAKRMQFEEEIQDLFLWGKARFEFSPGPWAARVEADFKAKRGLITPVSSLLMDIARREDERLRIRASIPSSRLILRTEPGRAEEALEALAGINIEMSSDPFPGERDLDSLLTDWGAPHHEVLNVVGLLVEKGIVKALPVEEAHKRVRSLLHVNSLDHLAAPFGHWAELSLHKGELFSLDLEQELVTSEVFLEGRASYLRMRMRGGRVFTLVRLLLAQQAPFTVVAHHRGVEKRIACLPNEATLILGERNDPSCKSVVDYLVQQKSLKKKVGQAWKAHPPEERPDLQTLVSPGQFTAATSAKIADELAEIGFWGRVDVELRNRPYAGSPGEGEVREELSLGLNDETRSALLSALESWAEVFEIMPGEETVFVPGKKAAKGDPAGKFFQRFHLAANVAELRRKAQASALEFARFAQQGVRRGYLRRPEAIELSAAIADAKAVGNDVQCYRLSLAGKTFGYYGFSKLVEKLHKETDLPSSYAGLEGDLDGVGLGAVLQALKNHRRTGTLSVQAGRREEHLYFHRGDAFLLRIDEEDGDAFVAFFLGDDADSLDLDMGDDETTDHSEELEGELKASFLDVLLWDGATFSWFPNTLPDEFHVPGEKAKKIALHTDMFLMEAIRTMTTWEGIAEVIGGGTATFEFSSANAKLDAIRDRGYPQILTLIDGRLTFDDLARISGIPRLEVGELLSDLVREGFLAVTKPETSETARMELPDPIMD